MSIENKLIQWIDSFVEADWPRHVSMTNVVEPVPPGAGGVGAGVEDDLLLDTLLLPHKHTSTLKKKNGLKKVFYFHFYEILIRNPM